MALVRFYSDVSEMARASAARLHDRLKEAYRTGDWSGISPGWREWYEEEMRREKEAAAQKPDD